MGPGAQRQRLVRPVAEPRVDEVLLAVHPDRQRQMVAADIEPLTVRRPEHARPVPRHVVAEGLQQQREGAVEVEAVPAAPGGEAAHRQPGVDAGRPAELDVEVLVRDALQVGALEREQRLDGGPGRLREPEPPQVAVAYA